MAPGIKLNYSRLPHRYQVAARGASLLTGLVFVLATPNALAAAMPVHAASVNGAAQPGATGADAIARKAYGELPIAFEPNLGQADTSVRYFSRGPGYSLYLTQASAVLSLRSDASDARAVIRMGFDGANAAPRVAGIAPQQARSNYFSGQRVMRDVAHYGKVGYDALYPAVDLVYYGSQGQLEYDFTVAAGGDPARIALDFSGVQSMHVDASGNLVLGTSVGDVVQHAPIAYQLIDGERHAVQASYAIDSRRKVGFRLGAYDHDQALVIDPVLVYSTYHGGTLGDRGYDIAVDSSSNAYVTGRVDSTVGFPVSGAYQATNKGASDIFVSKFSPAGALVYSTYIGGAGTDEGAGIAIDGSGNAYVTGRTTSLDFPRVNAFQSSLGGVQDAFLVKLNAAGNGLVYSTYLGGGTNPGGSSLTGEYGFAVAVDASGSAYVTGSAVSTDFPTVNAIQGTGGGTYSDAFVSKFSPAGNALVYSTYLGGTLHDEGRSIALDSTGAAYVGGFTEASGFPIANARQSVYGGNIDGFLAKLSPAGSALVYSTFIGGFGIDQAYGVAVDANGSAYVAGVTQSANFPVQNSLQAYNRGVAGSAGDGFAMQFTAAGNAVAYATYLGGSSSDSANGVAIDGSGNLYIAGETTSSDFPTVSAIQASNAGTASPSEAFVTKIAAGGTGLVYSTYLGGAGDDFGNDVAVNAAGDAFVTGQTGSTNFPTASARQAKSGGSSDAFVARISTSSDLQLSISDVRLSEGNAGTTNAVFTVSLNKAATSAVAFNFATANGTATAGSDYVATTLSAQGIPAGSLSKTISVPVNGDTVSEADEVFYGNISAATGASIGDAQGIATILNDDAATAPSLSIGDVSITEGNSGTSLATFTVSLSQASSTTVGFNVATTNGTATAGSDYAAVALSGQTIAAGATSKTVSVSINGDTTPEANETFTVNLSSPTGGAVIGDGQATGTINNDDIAAVPSLTVNDVTVTEGNSGTSLATFTVSLSQPSAATIGFSVFTSNNTAAAGSDYVALNATGQSIAPGATSKTFSVTINGDTTVESNETFFFNVGSVSGATVSDGQGLGTISNDDSAVLPTLSVNDVTVTEGNSGTSIATFTVNLSALSASTVGFNIASADGTASAGSDYVAIALAGQSIPAGTASKTFNVTINGDATVESDETFSINLSNPSNATIADGQATGTIKNDDQFTSNNPGISVNDVNVAEGTGGSKTANFTISLSTSNTVPVTFNVATANGTAFDGSDYLAKSAAMSIPAGQTSASFSVDLVEDSAVEPNETFTVNLSNVVNAAMADGQGLGTIANDDNASVSVSPISFTEGNSGVSTAIFEITLSMPMPTPVTFTATTGGGTATGGTDYVARTASMTIDAGRSRALFEVQVKGDTTVESNETFNVTVSGISGAGAGTTVAAGTIVNDDASSLTIGQVQGSSQLSPYDGKDVQVQGVVTATTSDGFFLQDATGDGKAETADGIFVASPAAVDVGDAVTATGLVGEASEGNDDRQLTLTRIAASNIAVAGKGNALPAPVVLDASSLGAGKSVDALERYEGMRVAIAQLSVVAPVGGSVDEARGSARSNGRFYGVAAGVARPFREQGLSVLDHASHANASPTVFDANPERLMIDSLGQRGARALSADSGDSIKGLVGVLGYGAGAYQLKPDPSAKLAVSSGATPRAVAARASDEATIASFDLRRLLDDRKDGSEPVMEHAAYATRLAKVANAICAYARTPDVLGLDGVENKATLADLASAVNANDGNLLFPGSCGNNNPGYKAYMVAGTGTRNLGFLVSTATVRPGVARTDVVSVTQLGAGATFHNLDGSIEPLSARPPLLLVAKINGADGRSETVSVLAGHVDALDGDLSAAGSKGWTTRGDYLRAKRAAQAGYVAGWLQSRQSTNPPEKLVVLGDFNASEFDDGHADLLGLVTGRPAARGKVLSFLGSPVTTPLTNLTTRLPKAERYTVTREGNAQAVDHILVNSALLKANPHARAEVARINADFGEDNLGDAGVPMRVSDHDPVVLYFDLH
jgi:predicted extracellular nuclease